MQKFVFKTLLFIVIAISIYVGAVKVVGTAIPSSFHMSNPAKDVVLLGNSHVEVGVNDSLLPKVKNFARSSERPEWLYAKAKLVLDNNPSIKCIGIGFDNVLYFHDVAREGRNMQLMSPFFLNVWDGEDLIALWRTGNAKYNFDMYTKSLNLVKLYYEVFRAGGRGLDNMVMIGGYAPNNRLVLKRDIKERLATLYTQNYTGLDSMSKYFLDKTLKLCRERNVKVFFFCPPQHHLIHDRSDYYLDIARRLYPDVPMKDFRKMVLPDSCFQDLDHLSRAGARVFTPVLGRYIDSIKAVRE